MSSLRRVVLTCGLAAALAGCRSCRKPEQPRVAPAPAAPVADRPAVLAELAEPPAAAAVPSGKARVATGDSVAAMHLAPVREYTFAEHGGGVVWSEQDAEGKRRVFHDGKPGPAFEELGNIALSLDGRHVCYGGRNGDSWRIMRDGVEGPQYRDLGSIVLSPDGAHLAYQTKVGDHMELLLDGATVASAPSDFLDQDFTADSTKLIYFAPVTDEAGRVVIVDIAAKSHRVLEERALGVFRSADRSRYAVSAKVAGGVQVLSFDAAHPEQVTRSKTWEKVAGIGFGPESYPLGYLALRAGQTVFVADGDEIPLARGEAVRSGAAPRPGERGFGALVHSPDGQVKFREYFTDGAPQEQGYEEAIGLVYGAAGKHHAYAARRADRYFVVADGKEGPSFDVVQPPAYSPDGRFLIYRARQGGDRFAVIADLAGKTVRELPRYEQVHEVRFTADGKSIAYGVKDGRQLTWKVEPLP